MKEKGTLLHSKMIKMDGNCSVDAIDGHRHFLPESNNKGK